MNLGREDRLTGEAVTDRNGHEPRLRQDPVRVPGPFAACPATTVDIDHRRPILPGRHIGCQEIELQCPLASGAIFDTQFLAHAHCPFMRIPAYRCNQPVFAQVSVYFDSESVRPESVMSHFDIVRVPDVILDKANPRAYLLATS